MFVGFLREHAFVYNSLPVLFWASFYIRKATQTMDPNRLPENKDG